MESPKNEVLLAGADHIVDFQLNRATQTATVDRARKKLKELVQEIEPACGDASGLLGCKGMGLFTA